jgi:phage-related protein (TIGR01555 family)
MGIQLSMLNGTTGGSTLSSYGTAAYSNNYSLLTLNRIILTYMYTGNGIFQTAIQLPIQDAIGKGIDIQSGELDNDDIDEVMSYWEDIGLWEAVLNYWTWVRLYGGGALLVNSNQDPQKPLNLNGLDRTPLDFYDIDRWQLDTNQAIFDDWDSYSLSASNNNDMIYLYGEPIHESRFLRSKGKRAPHYVRRVLRGWGMSEGERMIRDLNLYLKTQDVLYEILDESKVDVYKINGLAQKLMQSGGTAKITQRVQAANEIKNYVNALVLDSQEDYEQKSMSFSGLAEVMNQNRMGVSAALRIPMAKLFGEAASGFSSGEDTLQNYNAMVESEIRAPLKPVIRKLLKITMSHVLGYVPSFTFDFPSLRELKPEIEDQIKTGDTNRILSLFDRGIIDSQETMESLRKAGVIDIETKAERGLVQNPIAPAGEEEQEIPIKNRRRKNEENFEESKHKRDESGKFTKGGGGGSSDTKKEYTSKDDFTKDDLNKILDGEIDLPDGWYIHGRNDTKTFGGSEYPTQFTTDPEVAKSYAGEVGGIHIIKPSEKSTSINFSSPYSDDMDNFINNLREVWEDQKDESPFSDVIEQISAAKGLEDISFEDFEEAVREEFSPENIVDSARAYDSEDFTALLGWATGTDGDDWPDFIETKDGAIMMPGALDYMEHVDVNKTLKNKRSIRNLFKKKK